MIHPAEHLAKEYMMNIATHPASRTYDLAKVDTTANQFQHSAKQSASVEEAETLRNEFSKFVGETFFGQMMKAMRSSLEKPAYFHGGHAEEVFRSQLDQQISQELAEQSGDRFAGPMFEQQFPQQAKLLREAEQTGSLNDLSALRRR